MLDPLRSKHSCAVGRLCSYGFAASRTYGLPVCFSSPRQLAALSAARPCWVPGGPCTAAPYRRACARIAVLRVVPKGCLCASFPHQLLECVGGLAHPPVLDTAVACAFHFRLFWSRCLWDPVCFFFFPQTVTITSHFWLFWCASGLPECPPPPERILYQLILGCSGTRPYGLPVRPPSPQQVLE